MSLPLYPIYIVGESVNDTYNATHGLGTRNFQHHPSWDYRDVLEGDIKVLTECPVSWKLLNDGSASEEDHDAGVCKRHWNDVGYRAEGKVIEVHEYNGNTHTVDYMLLPTSRWWADNVPYWVNDGKRGGDIDGQTYVAEPVSLTVVDGELIVSASDGIPVVDAVRFTD